MHKLIYAVLDKGIKPEDIANLISWRRSNLFVHFDGRFEGEEFASMVDQKYSGGKLLRSQRYFCKDNELFRLPNKTYALSNQWGTRTEETASKILRMWPELKIRYEKQA